MKIRTFVGSFANFLEKVEFEKSIKSARPISGAVMIRVIKFGDFHFRLVAGLQRGGGGMTFPQVGGGGGGVKHPPGPQNCIKF